MQKALVKFVSGVLSIVSEVQMNTFEMQDFAQLTADATAFVKTLCYDLYLKRRDFIKISIKSEYSFIKKILLKPQLQIIQLDCY